jgi:hypothetical protein
MINRGGWKPFIRDPWNCERSDILLKFELPHQIGHRARVVNGLDLNHTDQSSNGFGLARSNRVGVVTTLSFCDR